MKIAFIGQKGIPMKFGGVERHVEELSAQLAENGHEVFVYVRNNYTDKNLKKYRGVNLIHLPSISTKHLDAISHTFLATVHALFQNYDVIHYQAIGPSSLSFLVKIFRPGIKLVATHHCQDYFHQKWNFIARASLRLGEFVACKVADKTIVISESLLKQLEKRFNKKFFKIPNGFSIEADSGAEELAKFGLQKNEYILAVSRFIRHKGLQYLIEAYKELEKNNTTQGKKLVIVGDGFHTDDYVQELKNLSKDDANIILTGAQNGKVLSQLFSNAYLVVQPSESEGLSIVILEAMGYGKAVVASDIEENKEPLGEHGVYFKNKNTSSLRICLENLLNQQALVLELGEKNKERANAEFDWREIAKKTEEVYKSIKK